MRTLRTILPVLALCAALTTPLAARADVQGADFDSMPPGPYTGPALVTGAPGAVQVVPAANLGASAPPGASGNVMCINNKNGSGAVTVTSQAEETVYSRALGRLSGHARRRGRGQRRGAGPPQLEGLMKVSHRRVCQRKKTC